MTGREAAHANERDGVLNVLDLFSGIGGISLGLERTGGFRTVAFCEIEPYCQAILAERWPGVPIFDDVRTLNADSLCRSHSAIGTPERSRSTTQGCPLAQSQSDTASRGKQCTPSFNEEDACFARNTDTAIPTISTVAEHAQTSEHTVEPRRPSRVGDSSQPHASDADQMAECATAGVQCRRTTTTTPDRLTCAGCASGAITNGTEHTTRKEVMPSEAVGADASLLGRVDVIVGGFP